MATPMIGLSTYRNRGQMTIYDGELAVLPSQYVEGVTQSGGIAVLLPSQSVTGEQTTKIIGRLDGLVMTGGADINLQRYGQELGPTRRPQKTCVIRSRTPFFAQHSADVCRCWAFAKALKCSTSTWEGLSTNTCLVFLVTIATRLVMGCFAPK
jgi:hypothetical protein